MDGDSLNKFDSSMEKVADCEGERNIWYTLFASMVAIILLLANEGEDKIMKRIPITVFFIDGSCIRINIAYNMVLSQVLEISRISWEKYTRGRSFFICSSNVVGPLSRGE